MPSTNPRLALTLLPHRHELLKRLAELQGVSMASVVSELLEEFYPVLERVCVVLEAAKTAQETSKTGLRDAVAKAEEELIPLAEATLGQFDLFLQRVEGAVGGPDVRQHTGRPTAPPPAVEPGANPRVVTRGSGSQPPLPSRPGQTARKAGRKGVSGK